MNLENVLSNPLTKKYLKETIYTDRIAHAQLFIGEEGVGTLPTAIAYATEILTKTGNDNTKIKCEHLTHPDLHFAYPTATTTKIKDHPYSTLFLEEWRQFINKNPYGTLFDWYQFIGIANKQGKIGVDDAKEITSNLSLKSFEGGYKIMIIWMAELMNTDCSNKLLKLLEEPPAQTIFILVVENESLLLDTILSRCQITRFTKLGDQIITNALLEKGITDSEAQKIAIRAQGNFRRALSFLNKDSDNLFEEWFVRWVRMAYSAKGNKGILPSMLAWSEEIAKEGRETQKLFLEYCLEVFRQALLANYGVDSLVYIQFNSNFKIQNFAPFVHHNNIQEIQQNIEEALYHIERNGNSKLILTDLSIKLIRLIHTKVS
ncbi:MULTISPECIES: ATP-binding protein [unclassified Capnocytophaga]|jgi:DNA polymerase III, gamma/tau subunits|uniref:DNA polymerase III subunit n=1 Tax=unclassified Capnocytophaga TaxID=2640652 RepID=UPI000202E04A|nr:MULTISPECIES: DNA polymerase III subunit delta' [unclassified Capnocytophaga]EGD34412.1 DNA polymerase III subunit delta [Capnocytophaga sp. oral taxon 338 str. F0234]MEB3005691.1 DNA polymerase III subunit delta' [Capnocytophaga sp. G2]